MIDSGKLYNLKMLAINESAAITAVGRYRKGIKWTILVNLSTTTIIVVISLDLGNSTMKSIEISDQALLGVESDDNKP